MSSCIKMMLDVCVMRGKGLLGARFILRVLTTSLYHSETTTLIMRSIFGLARLLQDRSETMTTSRHGQTRLTVSGSNRQTAKHASSPWLHRIHNLGPAGGLGVNDSTLLNMQSELV